MVNEGLRGRSVSRAARTGPNIMSQCSTMFVMRLSNDRDQALIRSAISDAGASMLTFVPSLGTGEVFAFGAGVPLPTRMKFREVPAALRPTSEAGGNTRRRGRRFARPQHDRFRDRSLACLDHEQGPASTRTAASSAPGATTSRRRARRCRDISRPLMRRDTAAPPVQPAMQPPPLAHRPPRRAPAALAASRRRRRRPSILRRPLSSEPLGPNNPAPLPSRYR